MSEKAEASEPFPKYHKINGVYKRDDRGRFLMGEWARPEFEYLADVPWRWTEKVDGMNVRVHLTPDAPPAFAGRTAAAQFHPDLLKRMQSLFPDEMRNEAPMTLYGEGYGAGIQKGGGRYCPEKDFILFDVSVGGYWLERFAVTEVAGQLALAVVPRLLDQSLRSMIELVSGGGLESDWTGADPEGVVGTPLVQMFNRHGERIIVKMKVKDFR